MIQKPPHFTGTVDLDGDDAPGDPAEHEQENTGDSHIESGDSPTEAADFADEFDRDHDFPEAGEDVADDAARRKRNSNLITYGGGAVLFVIILAVGYFQFAPMFKGNGEHAQVVQVPKTQPRLASGVPDPGNAKTIPAPVNSANNTLPPPPGESNNIPMPNIVPVAPMSATAMAPTSQPLPSQPAPATVVQLPIVSQPASQPSVTSSVNLPAAGQPQSNSSLVQPNTMNAPMTNPAMTNPSMINPSMTNPAANSMLTAKVDDLAGKVTALQASVASLTAQQNASPQLQQIQNSLESLQRQVSSLSGQTGSNTVAASSSHSRHTSHGIVKQDHAAAASTSDDSFVPLSESKAPAAAVSRHRAQAAAAVPSGGQSNGQSGGWILRSATPGSAMIGKPGSNDLQHVTVGDTVSGLGRITAISDSGGRWMVKGTNGSIGQ